MDAQELVDAVHWAVEGGAQIINMSLAFDFPGLVHWWVEQGLEVDDAFAFGPGADAGPAEGWEPCDLEGARAAGMQAALVARPEVTLLTLAEKALKGEFPLAPAAKMHT